MNSTYQDDRFSGVGLVPLSQAELRAVDGGDSYDNGYEVGYLVGRVAFAVVVAVITRRLVPAPIV